MTQINSGQYIDTLGVFVFGTTNGEFGYFALLGMPSVNPVILHSSLIGHSNPNIYIKVSPDFSHVSMTYSDTA